MKSSLKELRLVSPDRLQAEESLLVCTIGRGGIAGPGTKREGDLKTPVGDFLLRACYYRPDRITLPSTELPVIALTPEDGWCDDPAHSHYNQPVKLPFAARHERLWREDHVYDLIIPLGYNDGVEGPVVAGAGSAIFLHLMREDGQGTEGCVAMQREDLWGLLPRLSVNTRLIIPETLAF